jgi:hypothetical protein
VFAVFGKESAWDQPFDPSLQDPFWEVGYAQTADRISAELAVGERTYGSSGRASFNALFPNGSTSIGYVEEPTTEGRNPYERGGPFSTDPGNLLAEPSSVERYILKRMQWNVIIERRRASFSFTLFDESREDRTSWDGTPLEDELQEGGYLVYSYRVGSRTELALEARRVHREFSQVVERERDLELVAFSVDHDLGPRTRWVTGYEYSDETAKGQDAGPTYTARLIFSRLTRTF